ncbi:MAG: XRE family transcriptional regulator [Anaerolineae bacterium]|nr:helix-turn-helix transcriptional regulator [Anaerolineales bacterium]MCQ3980178.1 XRE family transcriptional regulator [Anaerolineae bacterium]
MERFGEKLHALRERHQLTVRQLAEALEIKSSGYITGLEKGEKMPSISLLLKISQFFNISTDKLLKDDLELDS